MGFVAPGLDVEVPLCPSSSSGEDVVISGRGAEVIATGDDGDLVLAVGGGDTLLLTLETIAPSVGTTQPTPPTQEAR